MHNENRTENAEKQEEKAAHEEAASSIIDDELIFIQPAKINGGSINLCEY